MSTSKNVTSRRWLIGALGAAVVAFVLGVVGLAQFGPQPHRPSDVVYNALQLFVLGSDPLGGGGPLPWESNYAQAEHIGAKLAELPAVLTTVAPAQPFVFDDAEVLMLAKLEHQRWMDERRAAGFTVGPVRDNAHHPDLVDWPTLPSDSRAKDLQATRQLPVLLGAAGLYIARLR
jgi:hypothetical protein